MKEASRWQRPVEMKEATRRAGRLALISRLDHVAIATADTGVPLSFYRGTLGLRASSPKIVSDEEVMVTFVKVPGSRIEILEPTSDTSPIARFIRERGGGLHHFCFEVVDLEEALSKLKEAGVELIDEQPRPGRSGERIAFIHPRSTHHVLIELAERRPSVQKGREGDRTGPDKGGGSHTREEQRG